MVKIAVLGAGGAVGQPLSLLLRLSSFVRELSLYDRHRAPGVAVDLSHIPSSNKVQGFNATNDGLSSALKDADIVIVAAGAGVSPGMVRDDLFNNSAVVINELAKAYSTVCPTALMLAITNPINAIVPFASEILKTCKSFDPRRIFGVTTLDVMRAETFLAELDTSTPRNYRKIDVVGGHSPQTIVPLLSQVKPPINLAEEAFDGLVRRIQLGGREVYNAKEQKGAAALSTAYAAVRLTENICKALQGEKDVVECAYVYLPGIEGGNEVANVVGTDYFAVPIEFGIQGAHRIRNLFSNLNNKERDLLAICVSTLRKNIQTGSDAAKDLVADTPDE